VGETEGNASQYQGDKHHFDQVWTFVVDHRGGTGWLVVCS
jgi:hypothetical protein